MKFGFINPAIRAADIIDAADADAAKQRAGLAVNKTDHGVIERNKRRGLAIIVYEFGLFLPADHQKYFAIKRRLYAGNAVLYAFDHVGATIDVEPPLPMLTFFEDALAVEHSIHKMEIDRPQMKLNGTVIWSWPQEAPAEFRVML